ncbi:thioredoxin domain-containing protein 5-like [Gigantopelta aegis]|uniref:thioredoxin domain-containing protein 5-like n=1 Tax=Gigantopelta aegis TaxID=1735272 RepID=UPI001B888A83|nr:thioredoxin domain-containing protein 5-like [Gigantopelta aegis]
MLKQFLASCHLTYQLLAASPPAGVVCLTEKDFQEKISKGYVFVKFYQPWCIHCKRLSPTWDDLSNKFSSIEGVTIAEINCTQCSSLCSNHQVSGYPTLVLYRDGVKLGEHRGQRSLENLYSFVMRHVERNQDELY